MTHKAERENRFADGAILDRAEVFTALAKGTSLFFSAMERTFLQEFPASLKGCDERQIHDALAAAIERLADTLRAGLSQLAADPEPTSTVPATP